MKKAINSIPICGRPTHSYFTGKDKYLILQKHSINDVTPPISENESLFILVTKGKGLLLINGVEFTFDSGAFAWLQSYHTFTIRSLDEEPLEISVCVYDYPLSTFLVFEEPKPDTVDSIIDSSPIICPDDEQLIKIQQLFDEFEKENLSYSPGSSLIKVSILGQLSTFFISNSKKCSKFEDIEKPLGWKVILYLSSNFENDITAESVATRFNCNVAMLNRELRNISGYNFAQTLSRIRVNIASMALLYDGMPLSYIATHSGFPTEAVFYRTFKKQMKTTPLEYRDQVLNNKDNVYRGMIMESNLMKILNYTYSNLSSPINITSTSKSLYISESVIRDLVFNNFNISFKDLSSITRVRHAEALLLVTELPILDIAINVGFNNARSLNRAFHKIHNMTPGEYRTLHQGGE